MFGLDPPEDIPPELDVETFCLADWGRGSSRFVRAWSVWSLRTGEFFSCCGEFAFEPKGAGDGASVGVGACEGPSDVDEETFGRVETRRSW